MKRIKNISIFIWSGKYVWNRSNKTALLQQNIKQNTYVSYKSMTFDVDNIHDIPIAPTEVCSWNWTRSDCEKAQVTKLSKSALPQLVWFYAYLENLK